MNAKDSLGNLVAGNRLHSEAASPKSLEGTKLIEETPQLRQPNGEKIDVVNPAEYTGVIVPVYFAIAAGALIIFQLSRKRKQSLVNDFLIRLNRVPCMNCHFYTMNPHLKCAVNPSVVLTKQAVDCLDYHPHNDRSSH